MRAVHVVLPGDIDDPQRPSGGNVYDRRVCRGILALGWCVREHAVPGNWPVPDRAARAAVAAVLFGLPDGAVVLLDGLVASTVPEALLPVRDRLRLVVLVHMPLGPTHPTERSALAAAAEIVTTSRWTRRRLLEWYPLPPDRVRVAEPGADPAEPARGTPAGSSLLCVGPVTATKGHDVLAAALARIGDLAWTCTCVGSVEVEPGLVARVRCEARRAGIGDRLRLVGPRTGEALDETYAAADLLVLASRSETYGMAVTEALARALPVIASDVGGVRESWGRCPPAGPGALVPPEDPVALAGALRDWLTDADHRARLREAAGARRTTLRGWQTTTALVAGALAEAA